MTNAFEASLLTGSAIVLASDGVIIEVHDAELRAPALLETVAAAWMIAHSRIVKKKETPESPPESHGTMTEGGYA